MREPLIEGASYRFTVRMGRPQDAEAAKSGTKLARGSFRCLMSNVPIRYEYIDEEANAGRMRERLMAAGRRFTSQTDTEVIAHLIDTALTEGHSSLPDAVRRALQQVEGKNRLIVKLKKSEEKMSGRTEQVTSVLNERLGDKGFALESQSEIGASVSDQLRSKAMQAVVISLLGVVLYLALRFDVRFGVAATIATFHDVLAVLGICWLMGIEMNLLIVTALLTLAGYSLNDTVIIFDRIRENLGKAKDKENISDELINHSTNEVLSRSIVTSLTVFLVLVALYWLGGSVIHDFSFALLLGVIVGTYSSVFVASPLLTFWRRGPAAEAKA